MILYYWFGGRLGLVAAVFSAVLIDENVWFRRIIKIDWGK